MTFLVFIFFAADFRSRATTKRFAGGVKTFLRHKVNGPSDF